MSSLKLALLCAVYIYLLNLHVGEGCNCNVTVTDTNKNIKSQDCSKEMLCDFGNDCNIISDDDCEDYFIFCYGDCHHDCDLPFSQRLNCVTGVGKVECCVLYDYR